MESALSTVKKLTCLDSMLNLLIQKRADRTTNDQQICECLKVDKTQLISQEEYAKLIVTGNSVS